MITSIILLIFILATGYIAVKAVSDIDILAALACMLSVITLVIHMIGFASASYRYDVFVAERSAFDQTIEAARKSNREYEVAAIAKETAKWNQRLAVAKYENSHWFFGQYVDDRADDLLPIE